MGLDARRCPRASKMRYQPTPTHSVAERRHSEEPGTQSAAQQAVLRQQICASGALLHSNPIRTTRQRRAHGDRRSSQLLRFEDALLTNNCACRRGATTLCRDPGTQSAAQRAGGTPLPRKLRFIQLNVSFFDRFS